MREFWLLGAGGPETCQHVKEWEVCVNIKPVVRGRRFRNPYISVLMKIVR